MGREQTDTGYEWVNAWAASATVGAPGAMTAELSAPEAAPAPALPPDQLMRDIAEIKRARDALDALPLAVAPSAQRRTQALTLVPSRTDLAPVVVGGVLALVMLTVFGAAAAMTRLAR